MHKNSESNLTTETVVPLTQTALVDKGAPPAQPRGLTKSKRNLRSFDRFHTDNVLEFFNNARVNIDYSIIKSEGGKVITITSALPGEGKTSCACNLARAFAQVEESKVLIIDCDLHKPKVHQFFKIKNVPGLSDYLAKKKTLPECIAKDSVYNVFVLSSGTLVPNPTVYLGSKNFKTLLKYLQTQFDFIIIDTPPVLVLADACAFAGETDGVVLVTRANVSKLPDLKAAQETLLKVKAQVLGVLLNDVVYKKSHYGKYYGAYIDKD